MMRKSETEIKMPEAISRSGNTCGKRKSQLTFRVPDLSLECLKTEDRHKELQMLYSWMKHKVLEFLVGMGKLGHSTCSRVVWLYITGERPDQERKDDVKIGRISYHPLSHIKRVQWPSASSWGFWKINSACLFTDATESFQHFQRLLIMCELVLWFSV